MGLDDDSTAIWKENWFDKYAKRPENLVNVTPAQFVANYTISQNGNHIQRQNPRISRYRNYDITTDFNKYKREMVTLHISFKREEEEVLADMKFIEIYDQNEGLILDHRKGFKSNLDIAKTMEICKELCRDDNPNNDEDGGIQGLNKFPEPYPFENVCNNATEDINSDIRLALLNKLGPIAKKKGQFDSS